ncbi:uncharacterized protein Tco025E_00667, partial [Trypanosoma conorhini]
MRGARLLEGADAEPLLSQCRQMASEMEALRASEQRHRALVGEDVGGARAAESEDPSTRAQCLRGIESALAALGAEDVDEPAAAAIMRAAEDARAREEEMHERLNEAAAREEEMRERLDEAAAREEEMHERLDEAAAREEELRERLDEAAAREEEMHERLARLPHARRNCASGWRGCR